MPKSEALDGQERLADDRAGLGCIKLEKGAPKIDITLEDHELWEQFQSLTNEMIVTKSGRLKKFLKFSSFK